MGEAYTFRLANVSDIDDILGIEQASFAVPWSREAFYREIVENQFAYYLVIEDSFQPIGYCGIWLVMDEAHVTNIAILPSYRGRKLGELLMKEAIKLAKRHGAATMTLEARVSNHVAQNLYKKLGFQAGGIRKNYYSDNGEDALVMWVEL
ncbi:ribosomal protein S18-alanine N-acetyltransferase [Fictibacillus barbaricus]|jgi:[ribosomal protein S18]-alanine N-acetyltransferase|uniref:[Ribosomal protein bS18]-alanine N-acetyltransferase n=1 Tax=Fictibacillus barbaricus TaxID=182136 RepID=A0ABS2Z7C3_9BACL|nr:ribosomal protein S18-alanine N-acetyltransferase [Fictibacillus barbaricus]MBN3543899.1 ribosomal protein S18-alanine N-acetyltransferase [Fictibacillus barbaricus]GGB71582.1 ribosomal-protein-alanine acetyltransferase [Fictibacillus barbaricus]